VQIERKTKGKTIFLYLQDAASLRFHKTSGKKRVAEEKMKEILA